MRLVIALSAAVFVATPLAAATLDATPATTVAPKRGATLRDANATRLGTIDRVNADGSVQIIFNAKFVTIPADKIVASQDGVTTSLTKAEISKLH